MINRLNALNVGAALMLFGSFLPRSSNEVENEIHFVFHCNLHEQLRKTLFNDIILKYPEFGSLNEQNKILFLFNNIDPYIYKKLGYFIFEAFQKRKRKT